jgi:UDP-glucose 4-epimerase
MGVVAAVTGVSRYLGGKTAAWLVDQPGIDRVIGLDVVPPPAPLACEFVRVDIRDQGIADLLERSGVETVVHMGVIATPRQAGGRSVMKDINVIGTMQLLAACQRVPSIRHLIVKCTDPVQRIQRSSLRRPCRGTHQHPAGPRIRWKWSSMCVASLDGGRMYGCAPSASPTSSGRECALG